VVVVNGHMRSWKFEMEMLCKHLPQLKEKLEKQAREYTSNPKK